MQDGTTLLHAIPGAGFHLFLERFKTSLLARPLDTWLFLPTNRLIRKVGETLRSSDITYLPDHICTPDQFCEYLITRYGRTISQVKSSAARIILSDVMNENQKSLPLFFAQRTPSVRTLQNLQTLISVIIRREITYPGCLKELQTSKSDQINLIITSYKARLSELSLVDQDSMLDWAFSFLQNNMESNNVLSLKDVYFYGLFEPLPLEKKLITSILEYCHHGEYMIAEGMDPKIFADTGHWLEPAYEEKIPSLDAMEKRTAIFSEISTGEDLLPLPGISLNSCRDPAHEIRSIAEEIKRLHISGVPYSEITIAFPDLRYALVYADQIFPDYGIPYVSSSGPLLTRYPLISFYLKLLDYIDKGLRHEDLIKLIQSPFLNFYWIRRDGDNAMNENEDHTSTDPTSPYEGTICRLSYKDLDIISRTYGIGSGYVDWDQHAERIIGMVTVGDGDSEILNSSGNLRGYVPERPLPVHDIIMTLEGVRKLMTVFAGMTGKKSIREHIRIFKDILKEIGSPTPDQEFIGKDGDLVLTKDETNALKEFWGALDELSILAATGIITRGYQDISVPVNRFITFFRLIVQDITIKPDPDKSGVLLTGIREVVHQHYPFIFLAFLNEGLIPHLSTRLPFTNRSENNRMETRTLGDILRQERYYFIAALLSGERETYLSYHQHRDDRTALSSPFLDPLTKNYNLKTWGDNFTDNGIPDGDNQNNGNNAFDQYHLISTSGSDSSASLTAGKLIRQERWDEVIRFLDSNEDLSSVIKRITVERNYRFRLNRSEYDGIIGDDPDIKDRLNRKFGPVHRWSASMLESYARCPFRFYIERVIRIKPIEDLGLDLTPSAKGNLIHSVLCRFTKKMKDDGKMPLHKESFSDAVDAINAIAEDEFEKVLYRTALWSAKKKQLIGGRDIGTGIFEKFVSAEIERLSPGENGRIPAIYTPSHFEYSFGAVHGSDDDPDSTNKPVDLSELARDIEAQAHRRGKEENEEQERFEDRTKNQEYNSGYQEPVLFTGKIDRIEITDDGKFGIVDYKTGIRIPSTTDIARRVALQLPLYIQAYQNISGLSGVYGSYCHIQRTITHTISLYDPEHKNHLPLGKMPRSEPDWRGIMNGAILDACQYVKNIHAGVFPIQSGSGCRADWYCPYAVICRFQPDRGSRLSEWIRYPLPQEGETDGSKPVDHDPDNKEE